MAHQPTTQDIENLQIAIRQLAKDFIAQTYLVHELKLKIEDLDNHVHKRIDPFIYEWQC